MNPQIALIVCTIFVLFLLTIEHRSFKDNSLAVWIPSIWLMLIASRPLGVWFGASEGGNEAGSALDRWVLSALALAAVAVILLRRFKWISIMKQHKWLVLLLGYMFLSTFWSDITLIALRRWVRELVFFIMALTMMSENDPRYALESIVRRTAYVLLPFSLVLIKYYPQLGRQYGLFSGIEMWTGVTNQKNSLGRLCMISAIFLLFSIYRSWRDRKSGGKILSKWADAVIIFLAMYLLKGSNSATSLVCFTLGAFIFICFHQLRKLRITVPLTGILVLTIFLIAYGAATPLLGGKNVANYTSAVGRDSTLTGRTEVWALVVPAMQQKWLLGYGFGSFWTDARRTLFDIPNAHNGYLDILLEMGLVGLVSYALWLLSCAQKLRRALEHDYEWASLGICLLLMNLIYNITESVLNSFTEHMTATLALICLIVSRLQQESVRPLALAGAIAAPEGEGRRRGRNALGIVATSKQQRLRRNASR